MVQSREGEVIAQSDARPDTAQIEQALEPFRGDILQVPPLFSAVKVDGQRAYHLARAGEMPELAARPLRVDRLELVDAPDADHAVFDMICGKGGYVRSIARDLGEALGCHGHVSALRRSKRFLGSMLQRRVRCASAMGTRRRCSVILPTAMNVGRHLVKSQSPLGCSKLGTFMPSGYYLQPSHSIKISHQFF